MRNPSFSSPSYSEAPPRQYPKQERYINSKSAYLSDGANSARSQHATLGHGIGQAEGSLQVPASHGTAENDSDYVLIRPRAAVAAFFR